MGYFIIGALATSEPFLFTLYFSISTSLSLPDRSQQLFGPCLLRSAYQHAPVPLINIGECCLSASFSPHLIPCS